MAKSVAVREELEVMRRDFFNEEEYRAYSTEVTVEVREGLRVHGRMSINGDSTRLLMHRTNTVAPKYVLRAWIEHLAWQASSTEAVETHWLRAGTAKPDPMPILSQDKARETLAQIVETYLENLERPIAFFPKVSHKYAKGIHKKGAGAASEILKSCASDFSKTGEGNGGPGEGHSPYNVLLWGEEPALHRIAEQGSFEDTANKIWGPYEDADKAPRRKKLSRKKTSPKKGSRS